MLDTASFLAKVTRCICKVAFTFPAMNSYGDEHDSLGKHQAVEDFEGPRDVLVLVIHDVPGIQVVLLLETLPG